MSIDQRKMTEIKTTLTILWQAFEEASHRYTEDPEHVEIIVEMEKAEGQ
ncbi:hypothetical protein LCGC14_0313220 [marine sediment metagenome]|uniref:Uncharacterized protein n=1 Tax=marine sediment metagenome TaxID=412755 RepID=A0A0F9TLM8_9ZZZZ